MSFSELVGKRYSCRQFQPTPVSREQITELVDLAHRAPSACNLQPWHILAFDDPAWRERICDCYRRNWLRSAPVLLVICGDRSISWKRKADDRDSCDLDLGILVDHLTLAAADRGLGSCWIGAFDVEKLSGLLSLPDRIEAAIILPIGHPADQPGSMHQQRRPVDQLLQWNTDQVDALGVDPLDD
jgi:nitroreductase